MTTQVEEYRLGQFATVDAIVFSKLIICDRCCVDVEEHLLVIWAILDDVASV